MLSPSASQGQTVGAAGLKPAKHAASRQVVNTFLWLGQVLVVLKHSRNELQLYTLNTPGH